jgi:Amt family ammonium transporter
MWKKVKFLTAILISVFSCIAYATGESNIDTGDTVFNILSLAMVFFMIPGLALFYGGLVRKKNLLNTMSSSFVLIGFISLAWVALGYSISFGTDYKGLFGMLNFAGFAGVGAFPNDTYAKTIPHLSFAVYQMMFAIITPAIISGAVAERIKFRIYIIFSVIWSIVVYAPIAHWIWGEGGWLRNLGAIDFAGGNVVHVSAGVAAFVSAVMVGKRRDFGKTPLIPHNIPFVFIGAAILWFGWFGFNGGSSLAANGIALGAITATHISACSAMVSWMIVERIHRGKATLLGALTGAVVGLSSITAGAGFVHPMSAIIIGVLASPVSYWIIVQVKSKYLYDDALDVFACHGFGGIWGILMAGLFASKEINPSGADGLFYGNAQLFYIQAFSVVAVALFTAIMTYIILKVLSLFTPLRVSEEQEYEGLDIAEHDEEAYPVEDIFSSNKLII